MQITVYDAKKTEKGNKCRNCNFVEAVVFHCLGVEIQLVLLRKGDWNMPRQRDLPESMACRSSSEDGHALCLVGLERNLALGTSDTETINSEKYCSQLDAVEPKHSEIENQKEHQAIRTMEGLAAHLV
ncbi:hypothetical protein TNCV_3678481 [Trichonephila clavipes]|nr:hypothetical protein TNCV_3678481 [Trichonephila clavipes]